MTRRQVKAVVYGHVHKWEHQQRDGIHAVGLLPVGYVFAAGDPAGWVETRLQPQGCSLELRCLDPTHPKQGQLLELDWRPAA